MPSRFSTPLASQRMNLQSPNEFTNGYQRISEALHITSQTDLASTLKIRQSSISDAKRRGVIPGEWALKLFKEYGLNPRWVYDGLPPVFMSPPRREQDEAAFSSPAEQERSFLLKYSGQSLRAVWVDDSAMEPVIKQDSYVGLNTEDKLPTDGQIFGLVLPLEGVRIRRILLNSGSATAVIAAENPDVPRQKVSQATLQELLLGRVVWVMRRP